MKKVLLALLLLLPCLLNAKHVDKETATTVAQSFWMHKYKECPTLQDISEEFGFKNIYLFVTGDRSGYIVIAADDCAVPVLGHSRNGFPTTQVAPSVLSWLRSYEIQIAAAKKQNIKVDESVVSEWEALTNGSITPEPKSIVVDPLMTSIWNQSDPFNLYCPGEGNNKTPTGCVATAIAQVMHYWKYPEHGTGYHEYNYANNTDTNFNWQYGTLSADFENTYYDWDNMPDTLLPSSDSAQIKAVATLNYQCGVALDMLYAPGGSMAFVTIEDNIIFDTHYYPTHIAAEIIIPQYFGYSQQTDGKVHRDYMENMAWVNLLRNDLEKGFPIIFAGAEEEGPSAGHCFVIDGVDARLFFHINFGWGGAYDGGFRVDAISPSRYDFNSRQQAIIGMCPPGIESVPTIARTDNARVWARNRTIVLSGSNLGKGDVYDLTGRPVASFDAQGETQHIVPVPHSGLYLVRHNGHISKVFVH